METVELRVHGVHGTSPGTMLGVPDDGVGQVAGDGLTGVYRVDGKLPYRELDGTGVSVEAYSWGALTSGIQGFLGWVKRVLWLLLLPMALVNLAYWARMDVPGKTQQGRWGARAVRLSGILLTIFMVLTPCVIAIDLVAWQCYRGGFRGCARLPGQLDFLGGLEPTQRLAIATLVPMLILALLWVLSRATLARYEDLTEMSMGEADVDPVQGAAMGSDLVVLHPKLWDGKQRTQRLQRLHLTAGVCTIVFFTGNHVSGGLEGLLRSATGWTAVVAAVLGAKAVLLSALAHADDVDQRGRFAARVPAWAERALLAAALATYVVHLAALWLGDLTALEQSDFHGRNTWFIALFILLTALHLTTFVGGRAKTPYFAAGVAVSVLGAGVVGLFLRREELLEKAPVLVAALGVTLVFWAGLTAWHYRVSTRERRHMAWSGAGTSVLLAAAAWVALLFTTSAVVASANWLNGNEQSVGDLVATTNRAVEATAEVKDKEYVASGEVVIHDARISVIGDVITVKRGRVSMESLAAGTPPAEDEVVAVDARGTTEVDGTAWLYLPASSVSYVDSCLSEGSARCSASDQDYSPGGRLLVPGKTLKLSHAKGSLVLDPSKNPQTAIAVPQVLIWTAMGQFVWLTAVLLGVVICFLVFRRRVAPRVEEFFDRDPLVGDEEIAARDRDRAIKARQGAAFAHRAEALLDIIGAITSPVALAVIVLSMTGQPPWEWWEGTRALATASMFLAVGLSAGLVLLGSQIRRSEKTRKAVGVIWDIATFFPRAAHPLAPPCYAERVVPELRTRVGWALSQPDRTVVVSGHSQGSLIVVTMASRLPDHYLGRVRLITYGSQIRALYGRVFPSVFGSETIGYTPITDPPSLRDAFPDVPDASRNAAPPPEPAPHGSLRSRLKANGGEWVNLFRRTDPLGWRVFSDLDSEHDRPVPEVPPRSAGDPSPVIMGHSGYQHSMRYRRQLHSWTGEPLVPHPTSTGETTTLPPI